MERQMQMAKGMKMVMWMAMARRTGLVLGLLLKQVVMGLVMHLGRQLLMGLPVRGMAAAGEAAADGAFPSPAAPSAAAGDAASPFPSPAAPSAAADRHQASMVRLPHQLLHRHAAASPHLPVRGMVRLLMAMQLLMGLPVRGMVRLLMAMQLLMGLPVRGMVRLLMAAAADGAAGEQGSPSAA